VSAQNPKKSEEVASILKFAATRMTADFLFGGIKRIEVGVEAVFIGLHPTAHLRDFLGGFRIRPRAKPVEIASVSVFHEDKWWIVYCFADPSTRREILHQIWRRTIRSEGSTPWRELGAVVQERTLSA